MASGMPDYHKVIRPRFGGAKSIYANVTVVGGAETEIVSVTGRGMLYGGYGLLQHDAVQHASMFRLYADGNVLSNHSFMTLYNYDLTTENAPTVYLRKIYEVLPLYMYSVGLSYGITFETELKLTYVEVGGYTPRVFANMTYALI